MHTLAMPSEVVDRIIRRRGKLHIVDRIDPRRTAAIMIDMQTAYLSSDQPGFSRNGVEIIPAANALVGSFREAGGRVVWIRNTLVEDGPHAWPTYGELRTAEGLARMRAALAKDSPGHRVFPSMAVDPGDLVVDKYRYSAFVPGASDLDLQLRKLSIDTLIIGGVLTNVCCESTARDAMMLNYRVVMAAEATAAHTDEEYAASLTNILFAFGDVMTNEEILQRLAPAGPGRL